MKLYPEGGNSTGVNISNNLYIEITTHKKQKEILNGTIPNEKNLSIIDLGECYNILIKENNLPNDTDLIILKLESVTLN